MVCTISTRKVLNNHITRFLEESKSSSLDLNISAGIADSYLLMGGVRKTGLGSSTLQGF